jgi:hypothetical protein
MKKSSFRAQQTKRTHCCGLLDMSSFQSMHELNATYLVGVVEIHEAVLGGNVLVALALAAHDQGSVHVHVVACEVQADQDLEDHREGGFRGGEEDQQAGGCAAIGDHVQDCAEAGGLLEFARSHAIEGIEQAADGVQEAATARVQRHEVE